MFKVFYTIPIGKRASELGWLASQRVYPAVQEVYKTDSNFALSTYLALGMIVDSETLVALKLRVEKIDKIQPYRKK